MKAKDNPFTVERVLKIRYRGVNLNALTTRLKQMEYRAAIIGPKGSGKTTLMEDLQQHLEKSGRKTRSLLLNDKNPLTRRASRQFLSQLTGDEIVFLDGAEQTGPLAWLTLKRKILKRAAGLIITAHKPGLLETLIECNPTPTLFRKIANDLLQGRDTPDNHSLDHVYNRCCGNIRRALRQLYDIYANDKNLKANRHL